MNLEPVKRFLKYDWKKLNRILMNVDHEANIDYNDYPYVTV